MTVFLLRKRLKHIASALRRLRPNRRIWLLLLLFQQSYSFPDTATWQPVGVDTFFQDEQQRLCLRTSGSDGLLLRHFDLPDYPNQFWFQGDVWIDGELSGAKPYYCFGNDSLLLAAGYSYDGKRIVLMQVDRLDGSMQMQVLATRAVEILPADQRFVFKHIFFHDSNEIRIEVNGVPLRTMLPLPSRSISRFGFLVRGAHRQVRFAIPAVRGK